VISVFKKLFLYVVLWLRRRNLGSTFFCNYTSHW